MITHLIKPGTMFFFNKTNDDLNLSAGVLMVVTKRSPSGIWCFRHLSREADHTAFIHGVQTPILFKYEDTNQETIIGQLPPDELDATEWKPEYLLSRKSSRLIRLLKKLW